MRGFSWRAIQKIKAGDWLDDDRLGCVSLLLAAIFVAIERVFLFNELGQSASSAAMHLHSLLFGPPPYSFFDLLLGFQVPDDGIIFFLQPRNLLVATTQAIHLGINIAIVYALIWAIAGIHRVAKKYLLIRVVVWSIVLLLFLSMVVNGFHYVSRKTATSIDPTFGKELDLFSNSQIGIEFNYPSIFTTTTERDATRGIDGELLIMHRISAMSTSAIVGFIFDIVEDPLIDASISLNYASPPDDVLRAMVTSELAHLNYPSTNSNIEALIDASENAQISTLAGHNAASYTTSFEETELGHVFVRGAMIVTPRRNISLIVFGCDEPDIEGSVTHEEIIGTWTKITSSLRVEY
jgi:hypothetical protein